MKTALICFLASAAVLVSAYAETVRPALTYSKTFGGTAFNNAETVAVDKLGYIYVAGSTTSYDFPLKNAFQQRLGALPLRITSDGGATWSTPQISAPVYSVAASPKQPSIIYAGTTTGIVKSTDSGKTWAALSKLPFTLVNGLIVDVSDPAVVTAGAIQGVFHSTDGRT